MQVLMIAMVLALFAHDGMGPAPAGAGTDAWSWVTMLAMVLGPKLLLLAAYVGYCRFALGRWLARNDVRWIRRADRLGRACRMAAIVLWIGDLLLGWLTWVRMVGGDVVLADELVAMLPTVLLIAGTWWAYAPIDRRMRNMTVIAQLDAGASIYPSISRIGYAWFHVRHQMGLILVPLLVIMAWHELVIAMGPPMVNTPTPMLMGGWGWVTPAMQPWLQLGGTLVIFLLAPLIIRMVWDTIRLPDGEIRTRLTDLCDHHHVGVRQLLVWQTRGYVINAAVMGVIAPLRFILLTDALLEQMHDRHIEAVMAHEIGHVRKHHMFWMLAGAGTALVIIESGLHLLVDAAALAGFDPWPAIGGFLAPWFAADANAWPGDAVSLALTTRMALVTCLALAGWLWVFGKLSRLIEQQADAFAVAHLASTRTFAPPNAVDTNADDVRGEVQADNADHGSPAGSRVVRPIDAQVMIDTLGQIAVLNHLPLRRWMWRHGSIAWRQENLRSLVGKPITALPIDRTMRRVKIAIIVAVLCLVGLALAAPSLGLVATL